MLDRAAVKDCVVGYLRVSTDEQATSGLGLSAQRRSIEAACAARGWRVAEWLTDEAVSGSVAPERRPALRQALSMLADCEAGVLVAAKVDRIARDLHDLTGLLRRAEREGWALVGLDLGLDTSTPVGRLVVQIMGGVAEWERATIRQRTRDALAEKKARGQRLGRPSVLPDAVLTRVLAERDAGASLRAIAARLNAQGVPNATGSDAGWTPPTVARAERTARLNCAAQTRAPSHRKAKSGAEVVAVVAAVGDAAVERRERPQGAG